MNHNEAHKQIEDIIDARNRSGQYDILCNSVKNAATSQQANFRYAYSTPASAITDEPRGDLIDLRNLDMNNNSSIGPTDSEITLIRVKRESNHHNRSKNSDWDVMQDSSILGDGTHLGDSPSLVNLVTFVVPKPTMNQKTVHEYMVPLSSWEPSNTPIAETASEASTSTDKNRDGISKPHSTYSFTPSSECQSNVHKLSQQSIAASKCTKSTSVTSQSSGGVKQLFKCIAFWKRKPIESKKDDQFYPKNPAK